MIRCSVRSRRTALFLCERKVECGAMCWISADFDVFKAWIRSSIARIKDLGCVKMGNANVNGIQ